MTSMGLPLLSLLLAVAEVEVDEGGARTSPLNRSVICGGQLGKRGEARERVNEVNEVWFAWSEEIMMRGAMYDVRGIS